MKTFLTSAKITLVLVYLVIIAGALVRMTGSGMGCPDWPKCFGYYIPPTDVAQLTWTPNHGYSKGQVIIKDEALWVATDDFVSGSEYNPTNWRQYTKHDYAIFNPKHTWIEYINRLFGALSGIATFAMAVISFRLWKSNKTLVLLSWLTVFLMGFQAWLGATVVYSVLNPVKITVHMVAALVIVALLLYIIRKASGKETSAQTDKQFSTVVICAIVLSLVQIVLGTQVRQFVDAHTNELGHDSLATVLDSPEASFYIHRTLSFLVIGINVFLYIRNKKRNLGYGNLNWILLVIGLEILSGVAMYYFDFPFGSQTIHLVAASVLFGLQFYLLLTVFSAKNRDRKTLYNQFK